MKFVIAETVLLGREAFETLGDVVVVPDREISPLHVHDADALIVRSKTHIGKELLQGSSVKFVGTATAGYDHLDLDYFYDNEIAWCASPGCNANSVSEYVFTALLELHQRHGIELAGKTIGVIGVGEVGSRVVKKADELGMRILLNDPPVEELMKTPDYEPKVDPARYGGFRPLEEVLKQSDIITLHVPLEREKPWPTFEMANYRFFSQMKPGAIFVNAARGKAVENDSLISAADSGLIDHTVLDVWNPEPSYPLDLLNHADIASPHIAGYSFEGSLNGTIACYEALCRFFELTPCWDPQEFLQPVPDITVDATNKEDEDVLWEVVSQAYPIAEDDAAIREVAAEDNTVRGQNFDRLRKEYYRRREFQNFRVHAENAPGPLKKKLRGLGFQVQ
ncbi:4-phosphoerythronate dehydrogenase [Verrucomicrobiota bacterium]